MNVYGTIYDNQTSTAVPGASVQVTNGSGDLQGPGTAADGNGFFSIISSVLDQGGKLLISSVGYKSMLVDPPLS